LKTGNQDARTWKLTMREEKTVSEKSFDLKQINKKLLYAIVVVVVLLAIYLLK